MNKKLIITMLCSIALVIGFVSCEEEDLTSYMPTWKGFTYDPKPAVKGDSVTIIAQQDKIGHLIYKAVYSWTASYYVRNSEGIDSLVNDTKKQTVVYDLETGDPTVKFYVPLNMSTSTMNVSFTGEYHYSAQGAQISDGSTIVDGGTGFLRQRQSSQLQGTSAGSLTVNVK